MNASRFSISMGCMLLICGLCSTHLFSQSDEKPAASVEVREQSPPATEAQTLAGRLDAFEKQAAAVAEQIRTLEKNPQEAGREAPRQTELRNKLAETLAAALDVKFQLEQLQIQELQARLSRLERQVGERRSQRQRIIERRANELIGNDPTQWDGGPAETAQPQYEGPQGLSDKGPAVDLAFGRQSVPLPKKAARVGTPNASGAQSAERRIEISGLAGMEVAYELKNFATRTQLPTTLPAIGWTETQYPLQLIPAAGTRMSGTLTIAPIKGHTRFFWQAGSISLAITEEDVNQVSAGHRVTKVVYLSEDGIRNHAKAVAETLVSTRLAAGRDVVKTADQLGAVLAVLTLAPGKDGQTGVAQRVRISGPDGFVIGEAFGGSNRPFRTEPVPYTHDVRRPSESQPEWSFFSPGPQPLFGTLYVSPINQETQFFWQTNVVPVAITKADLERVAAGHLVTKAIYLSEQGIRDRARAVAETLESTGGNAGNPVQQADVRGAVLAVLHLAAQPLVPRFQLSGPAGMTAMPEGGKAGPMPLTIHSMSPSGSHHSWQFDTPGGQSLFGALEVSPVKGHTQYFWQSQVIPMTITSDDLVQVASGKAVTKVIYLSESSIGNPDQAVAETLSSTELPADFNVIREADQRGAVLAIMKLTSSP